MEEIRKPVHSFRYGNVECAIWANNSMAGVFFNTTFDKIFHRNDEEWGKSASFDDRDLPHLMKAAADAHSWIYGHKQKAAESGKEEKSLSESLV